jgi:molybdopterin synthase sulfur carrier subunit
MGTATVRVVLPQHLRTLAGVDGEVSLRVFCPVTQQAILDSLEAAYPVLCGTIRDHVTGKRRPMLRFFANEQDVTHQPPAAALPDAVASGQKPFMVVGAIAGG